MQFLIENNENHHKGVLGITFIKLLINESLCLVKLGLRKLFLYVNKVIKIQNWNYITSL